MGDDAKRWSVTYTKHVKQKRKVYQDGFLELHDSIHKIMLYDDCEKLLGSRIVKKDDAVRSGETLAFDAYLVDIGDPVGDHKPIPKLNFQGREKKITEKVGLFHGQNLKRNSVSIENRKPNLGKTKAPSSNLSPSQKVIREFKKNEMNKYGAPRNSPDTTKTSYSEWQVLYTTQIIQKTKKYHDGILRVATCGSHGRQVTLYDESRRLLDSRFLKKDEMIGSGESLVFDGHLVDIVEPEGDHKPLMNLKFQERNCTAGGKEGLSHGQQNWHSFSVDKANSGSSNSLPPSNHLKVVKTSMREWHALYSTHITQKAKKYHSGILRLDSCGSYQMQATLLNEDGNILSCKFLKLSDDVKNGSTFELPKYLVEIGEPRTSHEGCVGEPSKNACSEKDVDSNFSSFDDNFKLGRTVPMDQPLRQANDILSILRNPMTWEGSASVEQSHASKSSGFIQFDLQNQVGSHLVQESNSERSEADNHGEETSEKNNPVVLHDDLITEVVNSSDSENRGLSQLKCFNHMSSSLRSGASFSNSISDVECTGKSILSLVSSIEKHQVSDALKLDCPGNFQPPTASIPHNASSSCLGKMKNGTFLQPSEESVEIPTRRHEGALSCGIENGCLSHDHNDIGKQSSEVYKSTSKINEIPSFDLGF